MRASLELVTIAFSKLHSGAMGFEPGMATGDRLTRQEAACRWMGIVNAVNRLPRYPKAWAYYALVDGDRSVCADTISLYTRNALEWADPKSWEDDPDKPDQKRIVLDRIVWAVPEGKPVINQDLATLVGLSSDRNFNPNKTWGLYRLAVNEVFSRWDDQILAAVEDVVGRRAA